MFKHFLPINFIKQDAAAGLVVFLVALPLCLGIAMASGAPLFSGIISGIIGGIIVGMLSNSQLSVSGPAAGLTAIVLTAITDLGAFDVFLCAVFLAGIMQIFLGFINAGSISNYIPTNVIEGMLAGIGIIIILKQLPHAVGYDADFEGDESFMQVDGSNTITALGQAIDAITPGALLITIVSLSILLLWDKHPFFKKLKLLPGALLAVMVGVILNTIFLATGSSFAIGKEHLVVLPVPESLSDLKNLIIIPDFSEIGNRQVWTVAITLAIVASIETLLCIEAADRMDEIKRSTNTNRELKAQGAGNVISALLGGLPMTSVVVRTSANANAGAKTKTATVIHGLLLLLCALIIPQVLNLIPLATLAAVLLMVGYKLARPDLFIKFYRKGKYQFIPFLATLLGVVFTDLLKGVALGILISIIFVLKGNLKRAYRFRKEGYKEGDEIHIDLAEEVSFLNKASIKDTLNELPINSIVIIDASSTIYISHDVLDLIRDFIKTKAVDNNISIKLKGFKEVYDLQNTEDTMNHVSNTSSDNLK
jgi:MFS superfamily sulfate permease-like transporter